MKLKVGLKGRVRNLLLTENYVVDESWGNLLMRETAHGVESKLQMFNKEIDWLHSALLGIYLSRR